MTVGTPKVYSRRHNRHRFSGLFSGRPE